MAMSADAATSATTAANPIVVSGLGRTYGALTAVDALSLDVRAGEIVGLIGPNGAGKTTTLRMLSGILKPTRGRIMIAGFDMAQAPIAAKRRLAFMPDEPHLFEYLTVEEHLRLTARLYTVEDFERRAPGRTRSPPSAACRATARRAARLPFPTAAAP